MNAAATLDTTLYTVTLCDVHGLPADARIKAETRYCAELERLLGGPEDVARAYGAWCEAADADASEISTEVANAATRWSKSAQSARDAGLRGMGEEAEIAYFEVRLG
ncbi:hypothetical protein [uncultured Xylophilus sp.]|uniref:hypothetical protein n=1 Tax=uncultured Xylophilus sp. TaxID=296832 RepID=UPI0025FADC39|nr:hypothetical protein [uncultured Xylophilus sp.]